MVSEVDTVSRQGGWRTSDNHGFREKGVSSSIYHVRNLDMS